MKRVKLDDFSKRWRDEARFLILGCAVLLCGVLVVRASAVLIAAPELYWISYISESGVHLLQIDSMGNIVRPPTRVISLAGLGSVAGPSAIGHRSPGRLVLWLTREQDTILRVIVRKRTLEVLSVIETPLQTVNPGFIQVTRKNKNNFLVLQTEIPEGQFLIAFGLTDASMPDGTSWLLSPQRIGTPDSCFVCGGGVAADGRAAHLIDRSLRDITKLFIQPLGARGRPKQDPKRIRTLKNLQGGIVSADTTSVLSNSRRFLIYVSDKAGESDLFSEKLFLKVVNAKTGEKIGSRILLVEPDVANLERIGGPQQIAIDPVGRFVIYVLFQSGISISTLNFQGLDATGHLSGPPKILTRKAIGFGGIDLLKEE